MKKKVSPSPSAEEKVKTNLGFEELMKKALNTPLPKKPAKKKGKK